MRRASRAWAVVNEYGDIVATGPWNGCYRERADAERALFPTGRVIGVTIVLDGPEDDPWQPDKVCEWKMLPDTGLFGTSCGRLYVPQAAVSRHYCGCGARIEVPL